MVELIPFAIREHRVLLETWLKRPHVVAGWGEFESTSTEVLANESQSDQQVIMYEKTPVGFIQWQWMTASEIALAGIEIEDDDTADIDILIGEMDYRGLGIGPEAIRQLIDRLAKSTKAKRAVLFTGESNVAAQRAYEKCGFVRQSKYRENERELTWVMLREIGAQTNV
jgi:RimJ/RimL family protein N-acetyltransferase